MDRSISVAERSFTEFYSCGFTRILERYISSSEQIEAVSNSMRRSFSRFLCAGFTDYLSYEVFSVSFHYIELVSEEQR